MNNINETAIAKAIGETVAKKRIECGLTQEDVAEKLDIGYEAVSRIERGTVNISVARLCELAELFNCRVDILLMGSTLRTIDQAHYIAEMLEGLSVEDKKMVIGMIKTLAERLR